MKKYTVAALAALATTVTIHAVELPDAPKGTFATFHAAAYPVPSPPPQQLSPVSGTILYTPDGVVAGFVQVDLLAFGRVERTRRQLRKEETRARRQGMSMLEVAGDHLSNQWPWYAGVFTAVVAVDRIAENNNVLWHKAAARAAQDNTPPEPSTPSFDFTGATIDNLTIQTGTGNQASQTNPKIGG